MDKRKVRTQQLIINAFIELAAETSIRKIKVTDIVEKANISRKTFYLNYLDLNDLVSKAEDLMVSIIKNEIDKYDKNALLQDPYPIIVDFVKYLGTNKVFAQYILSENSDSLIAKIKNLVYEYSGVEAYSEKHLYMSSYTVGGVIDTIAMWYKSPNKMSDEEFAKLLSSLLSNTLNHINFLNK